MRLAIPALIGAAMGTVLLLATPGDTFEAIVPALVAGASLMLLFQPQLARLRSHPGRENRPILTGGLVLSGAYAAYFGSAVGILVASLPALFVPGVSLVRRVPGDALRISIACIGLVLAGVFATRAFG